jgi:hypothetical protein
MPPRASPPAPARLPAHLAGFEPVVDAIITAVRDELRSVRAADHAPTFVDKHSSGLGPSVFLAAARAGEFETFRVGKRFVARASDVQAYIERQRVERDVAPCAKADELDTQLAVRLRRAPSKRVARSRTSSEP